MIKFGRRLLVFVMFRILLLLCARAVSGYPKSW